MKKRVTFFLLVIANLFFPGCNSDTPKLQPLPPPKETRKIEGLKIFDPRVDILFVIDDSGSMQLHQSNLSTNFDKFISGFQKNSIINYHIGVITTSIESATGACGFKPVNGCLVGQGHKFIDRTVPGGIQELKNMFMVGTNGAGDEKMFDPVYLALSNQLQQGYNKGFYRPEAHLAVMFVTDASEQSVILNADSTRQFLVNLKGGSDEKVLSYGAIIPSNDKYHCSRDDGSLPTELERFFSLTKGKYYNLCDPDFGTRLSEIADDLIERVGRLVLLDRNPDIETIRVQFGSRVIPNDPKTGWLYDPSRNALVFADNVDWAGEPDGTTVEIFFQEARK